MSTFQTPPPPQGEVTTDSSNSPLVICDKPGDNTRRPARRNILRYFPGREPPEGYPQPKSPPGDAGGDDA
jgi:hypothetical protein